MNNALKGSANNKFFWEAFLTGISNPKDILFFVLFLSQFIDHSIHFNYSAMLLIFGWVFCDIFIIYGYGLLARRASVIFSFSTLNKVTKIFGIVIVFVGAILLFSSIKALN